MGASFGFIYPFSKISVGPAANDSDELAKLIKYMLFLNCKSIQQCSFLYKNRVMDDLNYLILGSPLFCIYEVKVLSQGLASTKIFWTYIIGLKGYIN